MRGMRNSALGSVHMQNKGFTSLEKAPDTAVDTIAFHIRKFCPLTGFTLIELLCVIAIIAVLFSLSIPLLSKTAENFYLKNKAAQIKAICELLKSNSVSRNKTYKLVVDFSQNSYSVFKNSKETPDKFLIVKDSILRARALPDNLFFLSPDNAKNELEIFFSPDGSMSSAAFLIVNHQDNTVKLLTTLSGQILLEQI